MLKILKPLFHSVGAVIVIALLLIHFVLKESSYQLSLLFYAFPLPVIIIIILILSVFINRKFRRYYIVIAGILLLIWLLRSFRIRVAEDIAETDLEIVFWNATHCRGFDTAFEINESIPEVLVLVEYQGDKFEAAKSKYPNYYFYKNRNEEIGIFSTQPVKIIDIFSSRFGTALINFETHGVNFYAVDAIASLDVPRAWGLEFIDQAISQRQKTIVLGDFNIPYESKYLDTIKSNFNNAFSEKGNGFRETWFWNLPILSLDHIWVSKDLEVLKTEKTGTFKSDHSMVRTYIR